MVAERTIKERRPPSGPTQTFVVYEKKTGAIRGIHHLLGGPPVASAMLTAAKQRQASRALQESVMKRTASLSGLPAGSLAVLELRKPLPRGAEAMRVDPARRRLVRVRPAAGEALSPLIPPR